MKNKVNKVYKKADISKYGYKDRIVIRVADLAFFFLISVIGRTLRFEVDGIENFEAIGEAGKVPIYTFWHDRIFAATYFFRHRGIAVVTSQSKDGEYIARFIQRFGYGTVRGSSTRGGVGALVELIKTMRKGIPAGFTVDGPKGPRYIAKPGPILLAKKTGNPIMPFSVEIKKRWTVNSWDKLQIPKPFSKAKVFIGPPIYISPDTDGERIDEMVADLQRSLDGLVKLGENWRNAHKTN